MNGIALTNDIQQIEFEIDYHKSIAGRSVWEIGRRLNHVKENDLVHGQFINWLDKVQIEHTSAKRMMKVASELPDSATLHHLGESALYLIATLPNEERGKEHSTDKGESKTPVEMTVRELQQLKKQLNDQADSHQRQLKEKDEVVERYYQKIQELQDQEPVEIEVAPGDYDATKKKNEQLEQQYQMLDDSYRHIKSQYNELLEERKEVDEKSKKYDDLTQAIEDANYKLNLKQQEIKAYKNISDTVRIINEFLDKAAGLIYMDEVYILQNDDLTLNKIESVLNRVDSWSSDLRGKLNKSLILEGDFTNE